MLDLQDAHDNASPKHWEDMFQDIAKKHNLEYTSPA